MIAILAAGLIAILILMAVMWLVSLALKNSSIVDIIWGPGFALTAWVYYLLTPDGYMPRKLLICILVTIWGLRLGLHIGIRNRGKPEDYRYQKFRADAGEKWWWYSFFKVFLLQGALMWLVGMPIAAAQYAPEPTLTVFDILGLLVWLVGFSFEAAGDWQLSRFKADPANKGKVMRTGLWRYTRHPNYFGDACVWWGHFLVALSVPGGFLTIFSPVIMTYLLMRVSGVAMLERDLKKNKPEYADYIASTNAFFPGAPHPKGTGSE
jgi:steroid 5-alpha reductase family enzyme